MPNPGHCLRSQKAQDLHCLGVRDGSRHLARLNSSPLAEPHMSAVYWINDPRACSRSACGFEGAIMLVSNVTGNDSVTRREKAPDGSPFGETVERRSRRKIRRFDRPSVAHLAIGTIAEMSREELIRVIDGSDLPLINSSNRRRLKYLDRATLARLAKLGRRCCRNQGY